MGPAAVPASPAGVCERGHPPGQVKWQVRTLAADVGSSEPFRLKQNGRVSKNPSSV